MFLFLTQMREEGGVWRLGPHSILTKSGPGMRGNLVGGPQRRTTVIIASLVESCHEPGLGFRWLI